MAKHTPGIWDSPSVQSAPESKANVNDAVPTSTPKETSMALKDELTACQIDKSRRIEDLEEAIDRLFMPEDGILAKMGKCVSRTKNRFNYVLGGLAMVALLIGLLAAVLGLVLSGINTDARAATTKAELVSDDVEDIRVEQARLVTNMRHMTESMQDLKKSLDEVNQTLKEIQSANNNYGPEKPK